MQRVGSRSYVRPNTNDGTALGHYAGVDNHTTNGTSVGARTWVGENVTNGTALGVYNLIWQWHK